MRPKNMAGYGPLSDADIKVIDDIGAELNVARERFMSYLVQGSDTDLLARLRKLELMRNAVQHSCESWRASSRHTA